MASTQTDKVATAFVLVTVLLALTANAQEDNPNSLLLEKLLNTNNAIQIGMNKRSPMLGKKYDRNCFFSPVQCMLGFKNKGGADMLLNGRR